MAGEEKVYGSVSRPASVGELNGDVYGIFERGGERHIAPYTPYARPPAATLCNRTAGAASRKITDICPECMERAKALLGKVVFR